MSSLGTDADSKSVLAVCVLLLFGRVILPSPTGIVAGDITPFTGVRTVLLTFLVSLLCAAVLCLLFIRSKKVGGTYAAALAKPSSRPLIILAISSVVLGVLAAGTGLWPWIWTAPGNTTLLFSGFVVQHAQILAIVAWILTAVVVVPFVEESIFRFGLLRIVAKGAGDAYLGAIASGLIFGILHFSLSINRVTLLNVVGTATMGAIAGVVTVKMKGNIWGAMTIHSARNLSELVVLFLYSALK